MHLPKHYCRYVAGALSIAALSACGTGQRPQDELPPRRSIVGGGPFVHESTDMTPAQLSVAGPKGTANFSIPQAYLRLKEHRTGGKQWRIYLETANVEQPLTIYSDALYERLGAKFGVATAEDIKELRHAYHREYMRDWVSILLSYGHCFVTTREIVPRNIEKWGHPNGRSDDGIFARYDFTVADIVTDTYYVPISQEPVPIFIKCPDPARRGSVDALRCDAHSDYNELVTYTFTFQLMRLNEFREINRKVRAFIDGIVDHASAATPVRCTE